LRLYSQEPENRADEFRNDFFTRAKNSVKERYAGKAASRGYAGGGPIRQAWANQKEMSSPGAGSVGAKKTAGFKEPCGFY